MRPYIDSAQPAQQQQSESKPNPLGGIRLKKLKDKTPISKLMRAMERRQPGLDALIANYLRKRTKRLGIGHA